VIEFVLGVSSILGQIQADARRNPPRQRPPQLTGKPGPVQSGDQAIADMIGTIRRQWPGRVGGRVF
jgi:hypothetical protein